MTMTNQKRPTYNTIPRYIQRNFRRGKISRNELFLLLWLRAIGNPYGIATTSLDALRDDVFPKLKKNTVNTTLLSLREKQYVYFELRQGSRRGSFEIHLDDWKTPKSYKTLDRFFTGEEHKVDKTNEDEPSGSESTDNPQEESPQVHQKLEEQNQKLMEAKRGLISKFSGGSETRQIRSYHNEQDNEHKIKKDDNTSSTFKGTLRRVEDFEPNPNNYEENECKRIALEVRDEYINPILRVLQTDGFARIKEARDIFRKHRAEGKRIENPAKYFQGIINTLRKRYGEH